MVLYHLELVIFAIGLVPCLFLGNGTGRHNSLVIVH